ncbi:hypothetical protein GTPT_0053 [Tatumella ptyseos ATCC 33301]|uniref:Inner membrane protein n=2 Tax=Tatumella ptyseos TaxID=82987 RepID=A0A085JPT4_9GAMM|nr:hypothetical protein [Tatumella ptyseos]KFD22480.1 hypothetical protein GTPT_0053 [Tatumella ptyseos ATCC 33301]SQK72258.1 Uncharacterised protein [Tatumella ptyseos]
MTMDFSKDRLMASGFTVKELQKLQHNIDNFGGTFEEVIGDLAKRFKIFLWVFFCCVACFWFLIYSKIDDIGYVFSGGISLFVAVLIIGFSQPPIISFKCWRFCRINKN